MKTIYLHGSPDYYGSGKVLLEILCIPENASNAIVIFPHDGPLCSAIRSMGIPLYIINMGVLRRKYFSPWGMASRLYCWIYSVMRIRNIVYREKVSRIYVNSLNIVIGPWLKTNKKIQLIWHLHEIIERPRVLYFFLQELLKKADTIIAVSNATKKHWENNSLKNSIQLLYNGFHFQQSTQRISGASIATSKEKSSTSTVVGMIGRIQPWKGQSYLLAILQELIRLPDFKKLKDFSVLIAGDAYPGYEYLEMELQVEINQKELAPIVKYLGYQKDISSLLYQLDLLIVPSLKPDPLPTVVLEAMFAQKAVLATQQGGCLELIEEDVTGFFIPVNDAKISSRILLELLLNKKKLENAGLAGEKRGRELFSREAFQRNWQRIMK
jgi:glycosyltransferase involved in cell wall biosynthesis